MGRALALALMAASAPAWAVETVRISVMASRGVLELSGRGLSVGTDTEESAYAPIAAGRARVELRRGQVELLDGSRTRAASLRFRAGTLDSPQLGSDPVRVGGAEVRGDVVVTAFKGQLLTVNVITLEDYLTGVLGSEMPRTFPPEALKAQAVAARTYALHKKLAAYDGLFHLGSGVIHQVYQGLRAEDPRTREAVAQTRGEVMTYGLVPVEAYFHASCGGRTEAGLDALGRDLPYLASVECPCSRAGLTAWSTTVTERDLHDLFRSRLDKLWVASRTRTGRVRRLDIGSQQTLDAVLLRQRLGYDRLKSLWFDVAHQGRQRAFVFTGRGHGHGAGLCQWGAKALADQGWDYRRILAHYYPGTELQPLY